MPRKQIQENGHKYDFLRRAREIAAMIPRDGVTLGKSVFAVNHTLYDVPGLDRWRFAYLHGMDNGETFVDCDATPKDALCRQSP